MEIQLAIIGSCILLSAFFSGMEIAFVSANKFQIEMQKKREEMNARFLTKITADSSRFITTMLIGNNIALVIYSMFMGDLIIGFIPEGIFNEISALLLKTLISTIIILVNAEFLPKAIFRIYANEMLWFFAPVSYFFYWLFYILSTIISVISDFFLKVFFKSPKENEQVKFSKEELGNYITEQLENADDLEEVDSEIQIFQNALEFNNVKAREIMIPRTEIVAVDINDSITNLRDLFVITGYSKILIYKSNLDEILGYVHAFDLFKKPRNIRSMLMPVEFVPETMMINNVLNALIKKKRSLSIVLDEFGGISGLVTIEDIVEELFGEIIDEHDTLDLMEEMISEKEFNFSARLEVDYLNETYGLELEENEAYETLGGYIVYFNEDIPSEGEVIQIGANSFEMLTVDSSKIMEVRLKIGGEISS